MKRDATSLLDDQIATLQSEIAHARDEAEARSTFLATVSHEIRDPMNGVLGMARLLRDSPLNDEQDRFVDAIIDSGEALLTIINDILDLSKVDAGRLELIEMDVDLHQFFDRLHAILQPRAQLKGLQFEILIENDAPKIIRADPGRLRQILMNLCGNSIKFTKTGSVRIGVGPISSSMLDMDTRYGITLRVIDTGPGIPHSHRANLFSAFVQADSKIPRLYGGSGLGLMIVQRLVQAMAGTICVEDTSDQGTIFKIDLNLGAPIRAGVAVHKSVAVSGSSALIIDGEERSRLDIETLLEGWSVTSRSAAAIEQGHSILNEAADRGQPFDVVLIGSDRNEKQSLQLVNQLRHDRRLAGCSIVIMASSGLRGDAAKAAYAGADAYIRKPLNAARLLRCLQGLASWDRTRDGIMTVHTIDDQKTTILKVLVVDDNELNCKLAEVLLKRSGHQVTIASDGQKAVEAVSASDFDVVLMDIQMPNMDGYEATRAIRMLDDAKKSSVPIIAITANAMVGEDEKCRDAGMNDWISKPFNSPDLMAAIDRSIE